MNVSREHADTWASWFRALGDPSRILILHLLATTRRPMNVGEIVDALDIGQATVSHHLKTLADTCFVHVERRGTSSWWQINERCLTCFPSAAEVVMGRLPTETPPWDETNPHPGGQHDRPSRTSGSRAPAVRQRGEARRRGPRGVRPDR